MIRLRYKTIIWTLILIAELETLLVNNYLVRTQLRELLQLPLYHILLTFLALSGIFYWLRPLTELRPGAFRFSKFWFVVHLTFYACLTTRLASLSAFTFTADPVAGGLLWITLGISFVATWVLTGMSGSGILQVLRPQALHLAGITTVSVIAPFLAEYTSSEWKRFANLTFRVVEFILQLLYSDVMADPVRRVIGTSRFTAEILPGCSGYEGMGLIAALLCFYFAVKWGDEHFRSTASSQLWILPAAMALAWVANIFRLVLLIIIGSEISPGIALRGFHSQAGWLCFTLLGLGLIGWLESRSAPACSRQAELEPAFSWASYPGALYLIPFMLSLLCQMLTLSITNKFNYFYGLQVLAVSTFLLRYRTYYASRWTRPDASAVAVGVLVFLAWSHLASTNPEAESPFEHLSPVGATIWIVLRLLGSVLIAPIVEELAFRGYLMRRLVSAEFNQVAWSQVGLLPVLISSILFAGMHQDWLAALLAGAAYALVTRTRGQLGNAITAHAVTNACLSLRVLLTSDWGWW